jgi:hypothetical protein
MAMETVEAEVGWEALHSASEQVHLAARFGLRASRLARAWARNLALGSLELPNYRP